MAVTPQERSWSNLTGVSTTVIACIQQIPHAFPDGTTGGAGEGQSLLVDEITATDEDYLSAVATAESQVPDGWRVLYVRTESQRVPTDGHLDGHSDGPTNEPSGGTAVVDESDGPEGQPDERPRESDSSRGGGRVVE